MQKITTQDWTQITDLDSEKTYILQAQYSPNYATENLIFGSKPINVMWLQQSDAPQATDIGEIDDKLKASGSVNIYVKSAATPVNIVIQEVI